MGEEVEGNGGQVWRRRRRRRRTRQLASDIGS
jgi:hypothetical protein